MCSKLCLYFLLYRAREKFFTGNSDWLTDMRAYQEWDNLRKQKVGQSALRKFCDQVIMKEKCNL